MIMMQHTVCFITIATTLATSSRRRRLSDITVNEERKDVDSHVSSNNDRIPLLVDKNTAMLKKLGIYLVRFMISM